MKLEFTSKTGAPVVPISLVSGACIMVRSLRLVAAGLVTVLAVAGCTTTIPETDDTPPTISLTISGAGIGRQRMTNPPQDYWAAEDGTQLFDLVPNKEYRFNLLVTDPGGVARAHLRMPNNFEITALHPENVQNEVVTISRHLTLLGRRDDPKTALVISGSFMAPNLGPNHGLTFRFQTEADDFGGRSGRRPNQRFMDVNASVGLLSD